MLLETDLIIFFFLLQVSLLFVQYTYGYIQICIQIMELVSEDDNVRAVITLIYLHAYNVNYFDIHIHSSAYTPI